MSTRSLITRRRLSSRISVLAIGSGLAGPVLSAEPVLATANAASAAIAGGTSPALGIIQIEQEKLGVPFVVGVNALGGRQPAEASGRWHIGSNAKSMTATMIARLVERG